MFPVCLFTDRFYPDVGGGETAVDRLAGQLAGQGGKLVLAAPGPASWKPAYPFFPLEKLPSHNFPGKEAILLQGLDCLYRQFPFAIIHAHFAYPCGYLAVSWARERDIPVLITCHGIDLAGEEEFGLLRDPEIAPKCRYALGNAQGVVVLNQRMRESAVRAGVSPDRLHLIPNGVNAGEYEEIQPAPLKEPYLLSLGRLSWEKGVDLLIKAFILAARGQPDMKLVIIGWGKEAPNLINQALTSGISDRILFKKIKTGREKAAYLQHCRLFVSPSRFEGSPISVMEAMASRKAVVAFDIPGTNELVRNNQTGLLASPFEADSLAQRIGQLLDQPEKRKALAERGYRLIERKHDWSTIAARYRELYEQICFQSESIELR
ncbi:MAG: glycosyltransferase family 4 protein [bacterium]